MVTTHFQAATRLFSALHPVWSICRRCRKGRAKCGTTTRAGPSGHIMAVKPAPGCFTKDHFERAGNNFPSPGTHALPDWQGAFEHDIPHVWTDLDKELEAMAAVAGRPQDRGGRSGSSGFRTQQCSPMVCRSGRYRCEQAPPVACHQGRPMPCVNEPYNATRTNAEWSWHEDLSEGAHGRLQITGGLHSASMSLASIENPCSWASCDRRPVADVLRAP